MDNPAYFTVLRRRPGGTPESAEGLLGSRASACAEAEIRRIRCPEDRHDVALVTMLDQDPAAGTPMGHRAPLNPAGFILASLTAEHFEHRRLTGPVIATAAWAITLAGTCRAVNPGPETFDVAALTITDPDPAKDVPAP